MLAQMFMQMIIKEKYVGGHKEDTVAAYFFNF